MVTQPDRPAGRGKKMAPPPVKELALRLGLPVRQPDTLKAPELAGELAALRADLFIVVAYGRILPIALLNIPRLGPWNVHASLLPKYRGAGPIQWAIIRGEMVTGVCVMRMEAGMDTGPVAACRESPIGPTDTAGVLGERLARLGADLLVETIPRIADGSVAPAAQEHGRATMAPMLKKEDGTLDFRATSAEVSARARGVDPWPGPSAILGGEFVKLFSPRLVEGSGAPGQVLGERAEGLVVACGQGAVAFGELQLPGRKRLPASAVLAGRPIPAGTMMNR